MATRADRYPDEANAALEKVTALMADADNKLSDAVEALAKAEDGDQWADGDLVNRLDAEVNRLTVEYREAEEENGRVQDYWLEEEEDDEEDDEDD